MMGIRTAFIDDHPMLLHGIVSTFEDRPGFNVVGSGQNCEDATRIAAELSPDVLVMDIGLPGEVYVTIAEISRSANKTRVLVFTGSELPDSAIRSVQAGASGYLLKGNFADDLARAIETVAAGKVFIDPQFAASVLVGMRRQKAAAPTEQASLNYRETQIVKMLMSGKKNKEIATKLELTEKTVKSYMTVLMQKMHARNRVDVVIAAQRLIGG